MTPDIKRLYDVAIEARGNAHCPISSFQVGAAVEADDGSIYPGCNVESVAFTISTHAEMNAIDTAVVNGVKKIKRVLVVTSIEEPSFPCALCRQKIIEFGRDTEVIAANLDGETRTMSISGLYPEPFVEY